MKLISWNVNGLRAVLKKNFLAYLAEEDPDVLCLQETKCTPDDVEQLWPASYTTYWNCAEKKGYSGTAAYVRVKPDNVATLGAEQFDSEGRLQVLTYPDFTILNGYWPNSQPERARLEYKLDYCQAVAR